MPHPPSSFSEPFADLTWDDLEGWVGSRSLERGRTYQRQGAVHALACPEPGLLVGRVSGGDLYRTRVRWAPDRGSHRLASDCSCPLGGKCKHAVALVLEYLARVRDGQPVPEQLPAGEDFYGSDDWPEGDAGGEGASGHAAQGSVNAYLESLSPAELIALVRELAGAERRVGELLALRAATRTGQAEQLVRSARALLSRLCEERGWSRSWSGQSDIPDYTPFREHLQGLLVLGEADLVVELGRELLAATVDQIEESNDEGETQGEIIACLEVVAAALSRSSLAPAERVLWAIDRDIGDDYGTCTELVAAAWEAADAEACRELAGLLQARLDAYEDEPAHRREEIVRHLGEALRRAGRAEELISLAIREAPVTGNYLRAVEALREAGRDEEAADLAREGIARQTTGHPALVAPLRASLREIAAQRGDLPLVAAFRAEEFFAGLGLQGYLALRDAARAAGVWPEVREQVLTALSTGKLSRRAPSWPLPPTDVPSPPIQPWRKGPQHALLTEIALEEGDHATALAHYRQADQQRGWGADDLAARVARGIAATYPDEAAVLWKQLAEQALAGGNRNAYEESLQFLRPLRQLLQDAGRGEEWEAYLTALRTANRRRPALIDTLRCLDDRPLLPGM